MMLAVILFLLFKFDSLSVAEYIKKIKTFCLNMYFWLQKLLKLPEM